VFCSERFLSPRFGHDDSSKFYYNDNFITTFETSLNNLSSSLGIEARCRERGVTSGVSKVFLRIARKSILFEQKT
jgi:hypothetical protein